MKKVLLSLFLVLFVSLSLAQTVYVTRTGSKYHKESCRYLKQSSIEKSLKDAIAEGYSACKVCKPPTAISESNSSTSQPEVKSTEPKPKEQTYTPKQSNSSGRCQATTKKGIQCKRKAKAGSNYCWQHGG